MNDDRIDSEDDDLEMPTLSAHVNIAAMFQRAKRVETQFEGEGVEDTVAYGDADAVSEAIALAKAEIAAGKKSQWDNERTHLLPARPRTSLLALDLPLPADDLTVEQEPTGKRLAAGSCRFPLVEALEEEAVEIPIDEVPWLHELTAFDSAVEMAVEELSEPLPSSKSAAVLALIAGIGAAVFCGLLFGLALPMLGVTSWLAVGLAVTGASVTCWFTVRALFPERRSLAIGCGIVAAVVGGAIVPASIAVVGAPLAVVVAASAFLLDEILNG